jgi:hypothetical protein
MRVLRASLCALLTTCCLTVLAQQKVPAAKKAIAASNFRWTTYQNGWVDLSYSLRNNTKTDVTKVVYRVIFSDQSGQPIHFEDGYAGNIPAGLAVMETVRLMDGGLNIYHATGHLRVDVLSYEEGQPTPP